jgi:hypothetical protein
MAYSAPLDLALHLLDRAPLAKQHLTKLLPQSGACLVPGARLGWDALRKPCERVIANLISPSTAHYQVNKNSISRNRQKR